MSLSDPRKVVEDAFISMVDPKYLDRRGEYLDRLDADGLAFLEVHFAGLPRKTARDLIDGGIVPVGDGRVDLGALRVCDLFAADLLLRLPSVDGHLEKLYFQGDAEERRMVLRALPFIESGATVCRLMAEAHRTNDEVIFESGNLDSDLVTRLLDDDAYNRVVLKCAFMAAPKERLLGWETRGNPALSEALFDFMTEREAAGRPIWPDTAAICALETSSLTERLGREADPTLQEALKRLLAEIV
ncbi:MAG: hypothetical protein CMJ83_02025 [Planctomycetes bacterium]|nr:hypothetical protein [Planctomycetota bacterium]